jgi:hypothetical protein
MIDKSAPDNSQPAPGSSVPTVLVSPDAIPAMGELFLRLEQILTAERPADMDAVKAERNRTIRLLRAVNIFVARSWLDPMNTKACARLFILATALEQLNDGVTHPMVNAETRRGPKSDRHDIWNARKYVCAALECFIRSRKHTRSAAAKFVASKHPILKRLLRHANEATVSRATAPKLSDAILSWQRQFQQGEAIETVQSAWPDMLQLLDDGEHKTPDLWIAQANVCLQMASNLASEIVLTSPKRRT